MNRWHAESCDDPEVVLLDDTGTPHCRRCDRSPDLDALRSALPSDSNDPVIPPDEPLGELNLYWPPTVQYSNGNEAPSAEVSQITGKSVVLEKKLPLGEEPSIATRPINTKSSSESTQAAAISSGVYERRLASDEFRLLVLTAPSPYSQHISPSTPVHVELEIHNDERYPEYETVSYTWGGESGDSSPCRPVFVGDYWDIVFQTRNCEDMLKSLRPERGIRLLWVDALCINQRDILERDQQVGKMGSIYGNAIRVIVYLGPDVASSQVIGKTHKYPARKKFEDICDFAHTANENELEEGNDRTLYSCSMGLRDILQLRYFSRIWVVQELLLSRYAVIRISDVEFIADHLTGKKLGEKGHVTSWVLQIAQGRLSMDSFALFQFVLRCKAADPRDVVFGILGLLSNWEKIPADYSLSMKEVSLGFLGHCLAHEQNLDILQLRHLGSRHPGYPSWAVPIHAPGAMLKPSTEKCLKCHSMIGRLLRKHMGDSNKSELSSFRFIALEYYSPEKFKFGVHIDRASGALTVNLVHLLKIQQKPEVVHDTRYHQSIVLWAADRSWAMTLTLRRAEQGRRGWVSNIRPGQDHIFMLEAPGPDKTYLVLILREIPETPLGFCLITSCLDVNIHCMLDKKTRDIHIREVTSYNTKLCFERGLIASMISSSETARLIKLARVWNPRRTQECVEHIPRHLYERFCGATTPSSLLDDPYEAWDSSSNSKYLLWPLFSKSGVSLRDLILLNQAMLNDEWSAGSSFAEEYSNCLRRSGLQVTIRRFQGTIYIELCFGPGDEAEARHFFSAPAGKDNVDAGPFRYWRVVAGVDGEHDGDGEKEGWAYNEPAWEMQVRMLECVASSGISPEHLNSSKAPTCFFLAARLDQVKRHLQEVWIDNLCYWVGTEDSPRGISLMINLWTETKWLAFDTRTWLNTNSAMPSDLAAVLLEGTEVLEDLKGVVELAVVRWPRSLIRGLGTDGSSYTVQII